MSNSLEIDKLVDNDFRKNLPRYSGEYLENNKNLANEFALFAKEKKHFPSISQGDMHYTFLKMVMRPLTVIDTHLGVLLDNIKKKG